MKVGIIGAGASGIMAAISAARNGHEVTILEHTNKICKKLSMTGNGKCNYTNTNMHEIYYNEESRDFVKCILEKFETRDIIGIFEEIGILPYITEGGYVYPKSEQAQAVVECLKQEISRLGIKIVYECEIERIQHSNKFLIITSLGKYTFDKLIIAAGSKAQKKTGSDGSGYVLAESLGHTIIEPLPALCGLKSNSINFKNVAGVRCKAAVKLTEGTAIICEDKGEIQFTEYGVSGIPVFQISGEAVRRFNFGDKVSINIDLAPDMLLDEVHSELRRRIQYNDQRPINTIFDGFLNYKIASAVFDYAKLKNTKDNLVKIRDNTNVLHSLSNAVKNFRIDISGYCDFDRAQVCSGGIPCDELKESFESKICDGLYFAGEIIDVNGACGGYNLHWAWASGYIAGKLK